jgi:hypothetical protein
MNIIIFKPNVMIKDVLFKAIKNNLRIKINNNNSYQNNTNHNSKINKDKKLE